MAKRLFSWRWATLVSLAVAEATVLLVAMFALASPGSAQWFDGGFGGYWGNPWGQQRRYRQRSYHNTYQSPYYERRQQQPDVDHSKAPAPKKAEQTPQMNVLVLGDSMADWLAYGLEQGFAESPEMGVTRKNRTNSGLIRQEVRSDPRGEHPDWPKLVQETLAADKPDFIVMMIGVNDRRPIREQRPPPRPAAKPGQPQDAATADGKPDPKKPAGETPAPQATPAETPAPNEADPATSRGALHEFRSEKWAELYIKRIDETIAAMKGKGVPVFWVSLPPVRGTRSTTDFGFLNDLFRSRADKGGIVYIDVTDGFVDEDGHFSLYGPDVDGQNRRLRTPDGIYFTQAGARKLAHFVERELQRWMTSRSTPVALPVEEPATRAPEPQKPGDGPAGKARPLAGPVISLSATRASEDNDTLIGGGKTRQEPAVVDAVASKVLVKGDPVPAPAGRADDFAWPRRDIAPVGADPLVAVATLPMTPMQSEQKAAAAAEAPAAPAAPGAAKPGAPGGPAAAGPRVATRQSPQRQTGGWFGNWGGGWQQPQYQNSYRQQRAQPGFFPFLYRR